jgi:hypothetical protein
VLVGMEWAMTNSCGCWRLGCCPACGEGSGPHLHIEGEPGSTVKKPRQQVERHRRVGAPLQRNSG